MNDDNLRIVMAFLEAWSASDMTAARGYLADDMVFESPTEKTEGIEAYVAAVGEFAAVVNSIEVVASLADDERVLIMYDMHTGPFGTVRAAEHYTIRNGKIASEQLVFDTAPTLATPS